MVTKTGYDAAKTGYATEFSEFSDWKDDIYRRRHWQYQNTDGTPAHYPDGYTDSNSYTDGNEGAVRTGPSQLTFDRLPPAADLTLGLTYQPTPRLSVKATVFNAFNARYYQPDAFFDYEPRLEFLPSPWEDIRAYLSAELSY